MFPNSTLPALSSAGLVMAALVPMHVAAQVHPDSVRADTALLDPVVVTAARVPVRSSDAITSVSVLLGEELRARGIHTLAEALRDVPGLAIVQTGSFGGATSLCLRGAESDYTKVLIDGVPVNTAGGAFDFAHLTLDNIERIEVVRGPASVLYGSDAVAGAIQLLTRPGDRRGRMEASVRAGSFGTLEGDVAAGGGGDALTYSIGGGYRTTSGLFPFNSDYRNASAGGQLRFAPRDADALTLSARYSDAEFHYPTNGSGEVVDSNQVRREERLVLSLQAERRLGARVDARLLVGANELSGLSDDQPDSPGDTLGFYSRAESETHRRLVEARIDTRLPRHTILTLGSELQWQGETATGISRFQQFPPTETSFRERRTNHGYYVQLLGRPGALLSYNAGARLDDNSAFGAHLTYRVGAALRVSPATRARGSVGTAFKEPTFDEQFDTPFSRGNRTLEPERSLTWEAAVEHTLAEGRVLLLATYFDQRFRDLIQYTFTETPDSSNYFNVAAAKASGAELELRAPAARGLGGSLRYAYVVTKVTDAGFGGFGTFERGQPLLRRPRHTAGVTLGYRPSPRGGLTLTAQYVGERADLDFSTFPAARVELAPHTTIDLGGDLALLGDPEGRRLLLTLRIANLLDRNYQSVVGFPAAGRTMLVGARLKVGQ